MLVIRGGHPKVHGGDRLQSMHGPPRRRGEFHHRLVGGEKLTVVAIGEKMRAVDGRDSGKRADRCGAPRKCARRRAAREFRGSANGVGGEPQAATIARAREQA